MKNIQVKLSPIEIKQVELEVTEYFKEINYLQVGFNVKFKDNKPYEIELPLDFVNKNPKYKVGI